MPTKEAFLKRYDTLVAELGALIDSSLPGSPRKAKALLKLADLNILVTGAAEYVQDPVPAAPAEPKGTGDGETGDGV